MYLKKYKERTGQLRKNQIEFLEIKNTLFELKNMLNAIKADSTLQKISPK